MRSPKLQYSVPFEFILTDEQRQQVESALQHDDIVGVRWEPDVRPLLKIDIVVVEFRLGLNALAIAEAVTFAVCKLQCLDDSLQRPVSV